MHPTKILCALGTVALAGSVSFGAFVDDFESGLTPGVLGSTVVTRPALTGLSGTYDISVLSSPDNNGLAVFDSSSGSAPDLDLNVNSGNILIIQDINAGTTVPNDSNEGGTMRFDFAGAEDLTGGFIDLVDFNGASASTFTLEDVSSNTRTFSIPDDWTGDPTRGFPGINRLFFNLNNQAAVGPTSLDATFTDSGAFDIAAVTQIDFMLGGSGGIDNFAAIPMPHPAALAFAGLLGVVGIRRR